MVVIIKRTTRLRVDDSNVKDHQSRLQPSHNIDDGRTVVRSGGGVTDAMMIVSETFRFDSPPIHIPTKCTIVSSSLWLIL